MRVQDVVGDTNVDYDTDDDGLIEIDSLAQLDAIRYDLNGDGTPDTVSGDTGATEAWAMRYNDAFPEPVDTKMGCPSAGCKGYELTADLDFDWSGDGMIGEGDAYWRGGQGWEPHRSRVRRRVRWQQPRH